jgi:hypothetical protein
VLSFFSHFHALFSLLLQNNNLSQSIADAAYQTALKHPITDTVAEIISVYQKVNAFQSKGKV